MSNHFKNQTACTLQSLKEEFKHPMFARLDEIAQMYLGMSSTTAKRRAGEGALPFPVTRFLGSQKSPYLVKLSVLAKYIDNQCKADYDEWKKAQFDC